MDDLKIEDPTLHKYVRYTLPLYYTCTNAASYMGPLKWAWLNSISACILYIHVYSVSTRQ